MKSVNMKTIIRNEKKEDERIIEEITRKAFYNLYAPGCNEHYLVHLMRNHKDFIPELDFVIEVDGKVVGNIMYTRSKLVSYEVELDILTFGPFSIHPEYQKKGYGSKLLSYSFEKANQMNFPAIIIYGSPMYYCKHGFVSSKKFNISNENDKYPASLLVKVFDIEKIKDKNWKYIYSNIYNFSMDGFEEFDSTFEKLEKKWTYTQEEFYILSNSFLE